VFVKKWGWFIGIAAFLIALNLGLMAAVYFHPETGKPRFAEALRFGFTMLAASSVIFTCFFNIWQHVETDSRRSEDLERERIQREEDRSWQEGRTTEDRKWKRLDNTMLILARWDTQPAFLKARDFVRGNQATKPGWSDLELRKRIDEDKELEQSIRLMFNYFEDIRQALAKDWVDDAMVHESLGPAYRQIYDFFRAWIDHEPPSYKNDLTALYRTLSVSA
jgi:hypothetical protein